MLSSPLRSWHGSNMVNPNDPVRIDRSAIEQLTIDAMLLADEAESYFADEDPACAELPADVQVDFACEAFRTTSLLKQLIDRLAKPELVGAAPALRQPSDIDIRDFSRLPPKARAIVAATRTLYERVRELEGQRAAVAADPPPSPAKQLQDRLIAQLHA